MGTKPKASGATEPSSPSFWRIGLVILCLLCVVADYQSGPYLPLTLAYIMLTYLGAARVDARFGYFIAVLSAAGRTYSATQAFPSDHYILFSLWQFATSSSVYAVFCYLLSLHFPNRTKNEASSIDEGALTPSRRELRLSYTAVFIIAGLGCLGALSPVTYGTESSNSYTFDTLTDKVVLKDEARMPMQVDGAPQSKVITLTIDDGPRNADVDRKIVGVLKKHSAQTVWFINCKNVDATENSEASINRNVLMEIAEAGNLIGNHSYHHLNLKSLDQTDPERMAFEIEQCSSLIETMVGKRPHYFRPPWGESTPNVLQAAKRSGMVTMPWNASYDSNFGFSRQIEPSAGNELPVKLDRFADSLRSGDVILMHDNAQTADSLDSFLSRLEKRHFYFVVPTS